MDRRRRDPRARRTRPVRPLRARALRRPGPLPDRLRARIRDLGPDRRHAFDRPRGAPVDRIQGHPHVRDRGAEGALPPGPRRRSQARRLRADRAQRGLGRLPHRKPGGPASRRLLASERREALHRQRGQGLGVHDLRPLRGGRQGSPHRADRREADEGLRGRRALRHHGAARERPSPPLLQGRAGTAGERPRRARRGLPHRDGDPQQRADRPGLGLRRRREVAARPGDRARHRAPPVRPSAGRLRAGPGQDRLDGHLPVRAGVDVLPDLRPGRRRHPRLLARVGDLQGLRDRVPVVRGQPDAAAQGRRRLPAHRALREGAPRHPHLSRSSRAPTTCCGPSRRSRG